MKKYIAAAIAAVMMIAVLPAYAAEGPYLYLTADTEGVKVGEEFTLTIGLKDIATYSFAGGIAYDPELVSYAGCEGSLYNEPTVINSDGDVTKLIAMDNGNGMFGAYFIGIEEVRYLADDAFIKVTFKALEQGEAVFTLFEDSDGTDGMTEYNMPGVTVNITIEGQNRNVNDSVSGEAAASDKSSTSSISRTELSGKESTVAGFTVEAEAAFESKGYSSEELESMAIELLDLNDKEQTEAKAADATTEKTDEASDAQQAEEKETDEIGNDEKDPVSLNERSALKMTEEIVQSSSASVDIKTEETKEDSVLNTDSTAAEPEKNSSGALAPVIIIILIAAAILIAVIYKKKNS